MKNWIKDNATLIITYGFVAIQIINWILAIITTILWTGGKHEKICKTENDGRGNGNKTDQDDENGENSTAVQAGKKTGR